MPLLFILILSAPTLVGIALGAVLWIGRRRREASPSSRSVRVAVGSAAAVLAVIIVIALLRSLFPFSIGQALWFLQDWRFLLPLLLGILALVVLVLPYRPRRGKGSAELHRRTPFTYAGRGSLTLLGILTVLGLGLALFAGFLSRPDDEGKYRMLWIELGDMQGGSHIYGWYFSVPALTALAVLLVLAITNLILIARPPLSGDVEDDRATRRFRSGAVLSLASSAVALHVAAVLADLAATSTISVSTDAVSVGTSFAALTPVLWGASGLATVVGTGLCVAVFLSALPLGARRTQPVPA